MTSELGYLEKYSVAPAPSRDYYGIRILPNEVKLFLWKISHGPHRTPIVRDVKFDEFPRDKSLQDEIHRVFGESLLEYVRDIATGRINNWELNSCELDRGWARVLKEGQSMQKMENTKVSLQLDKKRANKVKVSSTGVKASFSSKNRSKILSKTPLEVIRTNLGAKKIVTNQPEVTSMITSGISTRPANELSSKVSTMKFANNAVKAKETREVKSDTKMAEHNKMAPHTKMTIGSRMAASSKIERVKMAEETKKPVHTSKSTIFKTDISLTKGFSSVQKKNVNLADLIREDTEKNRNQTSTFNESLYTSCLQEIERTAAVDARKSNESSPGNYIIENPWSSNSSISSTPSPNEATAGKDSSTKYERSYLKDKYKSARDFLVKERVKAELEKEKILHLKTKHEADTLEKILTTRTEDPGRFSKPGNSAAKKLDAINRLATLGLRNKHFGSLSMTTSRTESTASVSLKNAGSSTKMRSESRMQSDESKKK